MNQALKKAAKQKNDSWPRLILLLVAVLGMWLGVLSVALGVLVYALHFVYGIDPPAARPWQGFLLGLPMLAFFCVVVPKSWLEKLTVMRNLVIYSVGLIFPFLFAAFLSVSLIKRAKPFEGIDVAAFLGAAVLYYVAYSYLKAHNAISPHKWKWPRSQDPSPNP